MVPGLEIDDQKSRQEKMVSLERVSIFARNSHTGLQAAFCNFRELLLLLIKTNKEIGGGEDKWLRTGLRHLD